MSISLRVLLIGFWWQQTMVKWLIGLMVKNLGHKLENSSNDQMDTRSKLLEDLWS